MKSHFSLHLTLFSFISFFPLLSSAQSGQTTIDRIERMPRVPAPYQMRDWKDVGRRYVDLVLCPDVEGEYLPLSSQNTQGNNYPEYSPLKIDTYVGWNAHGGGAEAINVMPAVATAYLCGAQSRTPYRLAEGVIDFFNKRNNQGVYLNGFSSSSGSDWWYDAMPNVYFLQIAQLAASDMPADIVKEQTRSVADQWLNCVEALGGDAYHWTLPNMNYRAFNLRTLRPLTKGVREPESAGSVAWILYHAFLRTGDDRYRAAAELALEFLDGYTENPAYELQLAYGVQAMAAMNALCGTSFNVERSFRHCFDRGWLRGWGSIVGNWGGYDMSGLIGEANDGGNDYAFVMNGFQQAAALAPAVRYDKRLARAFARWMLNVANASRYFYPTFLPADNCEATSLAWSLAHDVHHVIPYESIKEHYDGRSPLAMGDALKGKWAATNLSMYSGSSVGYMAAVVDTTDVEAILALDLCATDFSGVAAFDTHLYYNPYDAPRTVTLPLPSGNWRIYDALTETTLAESAATRYALEIPADEARMIVLVPADAVLSTEGRLLKAADVVIDWHCDGDFTPAFRVKNLQLSSSALNRGDAIVARVVTNAVSGVRYAWYLDDNLVSGQTSAELYQPSYNLVGGRHTLRVVATAEGCTAERQISFFLTDPAAITVPVADVTADEACAYNLAGRPATAADRIVITNSRLMLK